MTTPAGPAALGLRIIHAIVFLGFASAAVAGTHLELLHLFRALTQPYNSGTPPELLPCISGVLSALLAAFLLVCLVLRRRVPLAVSGLMLIAFGLSFTVLLHHAEQRSPPGANVKALDAARALHHDLDDLLKQSGHVPQGVQAPDGASPYRRRDFSALAWHLEKTPKLDALPPGAEPGWLLLHVSDDRAEFGVTVVGIDPHGAPMLLKDEDGNPVELKGVRDPDPSQ
jgi:hypothetical protein